MQLNKTGFELPGLQQPQFLFRPAIFKQAQTSPQQNGNNGNDPFVNELILQQEV